MSPPTNPVRFTEADRVGFVAVAERKLGKVQFHCAIKIPCAIPLDEKRDGVQQALQPFLKRCVPSACIDIKPWDVQWLEYMLKNVTSASMLYIRGLSRADLVESISNVMIR